MRTANLVSVGMPMTVTQQLFGGEPVIQLDSLPSAAVDPEVISDFLDIRFARLRCDGEGQRSVQVGRWLGFHRATLAVPGRTGSALVGEGCAYLALRWNAG